MNQDYFSKSFGLVPKLQIFYSLDNLEKKDKIRFNYMLSGKGGKYGMLKKHEGKLVKPGMIEIKPEYEEIFNDSIKEHISTFTIRKVFSLI